MGVKQVKRELWNFRRSHFVSEETASLHALLKRLFFSCTSFMELTLQQDKA